MLHRTGQAFQYVCRRALCYRSDTSMGRKASTELRFSLICTVNISAAHLQPALSSSLFYLSSFSPSADSSLCPLWVVYSVTDVRLHSDKMKLLILMELSVLFTVPRLSLWAERVLCNNVCHLSHPASSVRYFGAVNVHFNWKKKKKESVNWLVSE